MITIFFQSVELVTLIDVTSGNDHNFFLASGIGHIFKFQQWTSSQSFYILWNWSHFQMKPVEMITIFLQSVEMISFFHQSSYF